MHLLTLYFLTVLILALITSATPPPAPSSIPSYSPSPTSFSFPPPTLLSPPPSPSPSPHCIHTGLSLTTPHAAKALIALLRSTPPHGGCMLSHGEIEKELKTVRRREKGQMMEQSAKGVLGLVASMGFEGGKVGLRCDTAADYLQRILDECQGKVSKKVAGTIEIDDEDIFCRGTADDGEKRDWQYEGCETKMTLSLIA